jgi:serine kinase of HPr protein (carbohydrate metabolism regulator)
MTIKSGELIHATAVLVGDRGVLITGASGSGKSSVANALADRASARGVFASLVCDDQCLLQEVSGRLICTAPETLRGGIEVRGAGLFEMNHDAQATIHLVVQLVTSEHAIRFSENTVLQLQGVAIAQLILPSREVEAVCRAIEAKLFWQQWKNLASDSNG